MSLTDNLGPIIEQIRQNLTVKDEAREKSLHLCRDAIRDCSEAIRAGHRQEFDRGRKKLDSARKLLTEAAQVFATCPEYTIPFIRDAQKEYAEGEIFLALVTGQLLPEPASLGVDDAAYLNGLAEAAGELRRYLLNGIRKGDLSRSEDLLLAMDEIYSVLITVDFPDAITGGLRRTTDMVRGVLEKTRSDLTLIIRQKDLETKLEKFGKSLKKKTG